MVYKIAVGSSDGENVDLKFGEVKKFSIFEVENGKSRLAEIRTVDSSTVRESKRNCGGSSEGCASGGCGGNGGGCGGSEGVIQKVEQISDCRCIVCKKIGFQAQKQLERKAISVFDVEGPINEILEKITAYYEKLEQRRRAR